jgi:hypothetical protein
MQVLQHSRRCRPRGGASDQAAQQPAYAREQAPEQAENARQQAADEGAQTPEHAHAANAGAA